MIEKVKIIINNKIKKSQKRIAKINKKRRR